MPFRAKVPKVENSGCGGEMDTLLLVFVIN